MHNRELDVAGARRKIENQIIEFAPLHLPQKLLDVTRHHWPAQNSGRGVIEQKAHRHQAQSVLLDWNDLVFLRCHGPFPRAEHERNARAINVAVTQAYAHFRLLKREGEIRCHSRFADAALATRHRDRVLDSRNACRTHASPGASRWRMNVDQNFRISDPINRPQYFFGITFDRRWNIGIVRGERELHFDFAIVDVDRLDQAKRNNVSCEARILNRLERVANLFF